MPSFLLTDTTTNNSIFKGIFDSELTATIEVTDFLLCLGVALLLGFMMAGAYMVGSRYTRSFLLTLAILPATVCVVIMMVNGNIGAGVAVAGAFSLVRFRSAPGSAKEIAYIFFAMGAGLIVGMGYLAFAALFTLIMCIIFVAANLLSSKKGKNTGRYKTLKIVIPENINYSEVFDDIFSEYTTSAEQVKVKTTNMGSLYSVWYDVRLKDPKKEKEFIDKLRCRNGNLEITVSKQETTNNEL
ncbi:MAG: DUF4956 domain-containing protein [Ruminococcaceae bacterium]|nr:DUF4956 domain-containing protein [Oscillospiraceae bacterium]